MTNSAAVLLTFALGAMGCASPAVQEGASAPAGPAPSRTLVMVVNSEVGNLSTKAVGPFNPARTTRSFNASLTVTDTQDKVRPYLAESLPQLNTDTWQVFPDGRMETTWKLRPGLTWHDGQPLTAEDFVFAFQIYTAPDLRGVFSPRPQDIIERLAAVDSQTIRISWRSPFLHTGDGLDPLPRAHLSEPFSAYERDPIGQHDTFMSQRFWTTEYVGAGPYRLIGWEPASHLEGEAFEGHAVGKPKIGRLQIRFILDENTALAAILAGEVHLIVTDVIRFEQGATLREHGGFNDVEKKGKLLPTSTAVISAVPQHRPEYQQTPALLDLRVRKALTHATDRNAFIDGLYGGQGFMPDSLARREAAYYPEVDRVITKYPYDLRRTEQLMSEAGLSKDRDGSFADASGQRFQPDAVFAAVGPQRDQLLPLLTDVWQRAGVDVQSSIMPAGLAQSPEANATFRGIVVHGIGASGDTGGAGSLVSENIGTPANRWAGGNRGGWSNPDYDLLWSRYNTTLDRAEQIQAVAEMMKIHSEQVPNIPLYYLLGLVPHVAALKGPEGPSQWNIHEWQLIS